jgi:DNA-binding transcriptional LysR family regulator
MEPTPRAVQLAPHVQTILAEIRRYVEVGPPFKPDVVKRTFSIATSDLGEMVFLPSLVRTLAQRAPNIEIRTALKRPGELNTALQSSEIDFALEYFPDFESSDIFR